MSKDEHDTIVNKIDSLDTLEHDRWYYPKYGCSAALLDENGERSSCAEITRSLCEPAITYSEQEVEELLHRAVNDSHCRKGRVKHSNSNECAEFVNNWFKLNKKQ